MTVKWSDLLHLFRRYGIFSNATPLNVRNVTSFEMRFKALSRSLRYQEGTDVNKGLLSSHLTIGDL